MADWLPGFERVYNDRWNGQTFDQGYPPSVVWHSIEGTSITSAGSHTSPPHFWIDVKRRLKVQTVRMGRGSYAMGSDNPSPNRKTNCYQIEQTGFATQMAQYLNETDYKWLGQEVLRPICDWLSENGTPLNLDNAPDVSTEQISGSSFANAPQRFSKSYWLGFNGACGHRHVWNQSDRYDPGLMDLRKICDYAKNSTTTPTKPVFHKDDEMFRFVIDETGTLYAVFGTKAWPIADDYARVVMQKAGTLMTKEQMISAGYEWNIDRGSMLRAFEIQPVTNTVPDNPF